MPEGIDLCDSCDEDGCKQDFKQYNKDKDGCEQDFEHCDEDEDGWEQDYCEEVYEHNVRNQFLLSNDNDENELAVLEFIHCLVETFDKYFENVCELDVMFNVEKAHFILEEMMANGAVVETNRMNVLQPLILMDKERK